MEHSERIAAVIVTFNNPRMLKDLLEDLQRQSLKPGRIIVVDNSTRSAAESVPGETQGITHVKMASNEESAGGFHEGLRLAREGADYILTLDDDVQMPADALEKLFRGLGDLAGTTAPAPCWGLTARRRPSPTVAAGTTCRAYLFYSATLKTSCLAMTVSTP